MGDNLTGSARHFHQLGYVTSDLHRAMTVIGEQHLVADYRQAERRLKTFLGKTPGETVLRVAMANIPGAQIEIVEPVSGQADVFFEAMAGWAGFCLKLHHLAFRLTGTADDWRAHLAALERDGRRICWSGQGDADSGFVYTDDRDSLGHFVEHIWMTPGRYAAMMESVPFNPN